MRIIKTSALGEQEKIQLFDLWNTEYPEQLSYQDQSELDTYLLKLGPTTHFLLQNDIGIIMGWAFSFVRDNQKWFAIILSEKVQRKGFGKKLLDLLKQSEALLYGWVIDHSKDKKRNGNPYLSPLSFYKKCDFVALEEERLELDTISAVKIKWIATDTIA
ncbi:GNAT family N-acetyltransferase [Flavobacterium orientale]|uniref:GNAT family N-acetyltransferase n=1 Tax=Flavobacterium orientale TaxID=1756020 RepID=UPI001E538634|nr:GNAT family N-acetyltransferase [Flavobacterium orientale]